MKRQPYVPAVKVRRPQSAHAAKRAQILAARPRCEAGKRLVAGVDGHRCSTTATDIVPVGQPDVLALAVDCGGHLAVCARCRDLLVARPDVGVSLAIQLPVRPH